MPQDIHEIEIAPGVRARAVEVQIVSASEPFSVYTLEDGSIVKMKTVATGCFRLMDMKDRNGGPAYYMQTQVVVVSRPLQEQKPQGPEVV